MTALSQPDGNRIQLLNDRFRRTFVGGRVVITYRERVG